MSKPLIDITVHIKRPVTDVFAAWRTADALASWFAPMAVEQPQVEMDFVEGGHYSIAMALPDGSVHTTTGVFREIVANETIVMTWRCDAFADPESLVRVQFIASGDGTDVHVSHTSFATEATRDAHEGGWHACLDGLRNYLHGNSGA